MSPIISRASLVMPSLAEGLIARYCPSKTGPTGRTLYDLSGNGLHGLMGVDMAASSGWERNEGGWANRFAASSVNEDIVLALPIVDKLDTDASPLSYSGWFFNTGDFTSYQSIQDSAIRQFSVFCGPDADRLYIDFKDSVGAESITPFTMVLNRWYHLVCTIAPNTNVVTPYLNGQVCSTVLGGGFYDTSQTIRIGSNPSGGGVGWVGFQDDIAIYHRVLTTPEIKYLATSRGAAYATNIQRSFQVLLGVVTKSADNTLGLADEASFTNDTTSNQATNTLSFAQSASFFKSGPGDTPVSHSLGFTQSATAKGFELGTHFLLLDSLALFRIGLPAGGFFINQSLGFIETLSRGQTYGVNQTIDFAQDAFRANTGSQSLDLTQVVILGRGKGTTSVLNFSQSVLVNSRLGRSLAQPFGLIDAVAYYYVGPCIKARYSRFEGRGQAALIPVKPYTQKTPVSFETLVGPKQIIPVSTPEMDNKHRLSFDRVNRETSGGELEVYRDPSWVPTETLLFTIRGLKTAVFSTLKAFMYSTLGTEILFNDWVGASWIGVVTNPDEPATEDQDGYWTLAFEFVGKPYAGPPAFAPLTFTQSASFTL